MEGKGEIFELLLTGYNFCVYSGGWYSGLAETLVPTFTALLYNDTTQWLVKFRTSVVGTSVPASPWLLGF